MGIFKLIYLDWLFNYSYSFRKQPDTSVFKNKKCCFPDQETWVIIPTNLLKKNLTHSSIFKAYFMKIFAAKASLVFIKSRCRSSRSKIIRNIHRETLVIGVSFLIKLQSFSCFPENIAKYFDQLFIEHLRWLLLYIIFSKRRCCIYYHYTLHISLWNLKSLSFAFIRGAARYHSFYHSVSFVVTRCTTRCITRCHSLYHLLPFVFTRCYSLLLVVTRQSFYKRSF